MQGCKRDSVVCRGRDGDCCSTKYPKCKDGWVIHGHARNGDCATGRTWYECCPKGSPFDECRDDRCVDDGVPCCARPHADGAGHEEDFQCADDWNPVPDPEAEGCPQGAKAFTCCKDSPGTPRPTGSQTTNPIWKPTTEPTANPTRSAVVEDLELCDSRAILKKASGAGHYCDPPDGDGARLGDSNLEYTEEQCSAGSGTWIPCTCAEAQTHLNSAEGKADPDRTAWIAAVAPNCCMMATTVPSAVVEDLELCDSPATLQTAEVAGTSCKGDFTNVIDSNLGGTEAKCKAAKGTWTSYTCAEAQAHLNSAEGKVGTTNEGRVRFKAAVMQKCCAEPDGAEEKNGGGSIAGVIVGIVAALLIVVAGGVYVSRTRWRAGAGRDAVRRRLATGHTNPVFVGNADLDGSASAAPAPLNGNGTGAVVDDSNYDLGAPTRAASGLGTTQYATADGQEVGGGDGTYTTADSREVGAGDIVYASSEGRGTGTGTGAGAGRPRSHTVGWDARDAASSGGGSVGASMPVYAQPDRTRRSTASAGGQELDGYAAMAPDEELEARKRTAWRENLRHQPGYVDASVVLNSSQATYADPDADDAGGVMYASSHGDGAGGVMYASSRDAVAASGSRPRSVYAGFQASDA